MATGNAHIGKPAPDFQATAVVEGAFKEVKLSDYRGKYVVLFFYQSPLGGCLGCFHVLGFFP